jgi:CheY-like chemotaxis protein
MKTVRTVLLIDDDDEDQEIFRLVIEEIDPSIRCLQSLGAKLALDLLLKKEISPDYIFLDLNMPIMNGFEFLEEVKKIKPVRDIPVIMLTTSWAKEHIDKAKQLGAFSFITKPSDMRVLKARLLSLFQGDQQLHAKLVP